MRVEEYIGGKIRNWDARIVAVLAEPFKSLAYTLWFCKPNSLHR